MTEKLWVSTGVFLLTICKEILGVFVPRLPEALF
mgnify:CR=1 FL=1